jgi:hypothetical protein
MNLTAVDGEASFLFTRTGRPDREGEATMAKASKTEEKRSTSARKTEREELLGAIVKADDSEQPLRSVSLHELLNAVVENPEAWLSTPSAQFGGRKPSDLIGTEEEHKIVDLLLAVDQGLF